MRPVSELSDVDPCISNQRLLSGEAQTQGIMRDGPFSPMKGQLYRSYQWLKGCRLMITLDSQRFFALDRRHPHRQENKVYGRLLTSFRADQRDRVSLSFTFASFARPTGRVAVVP